MTRNRKRSKPAFVVKPVQIYDPGNGETLGWARVSPLDPESSATNLIVRGGVEVRQLDLVEYQQQHPDALFATEEEAAQEGIDLLRAGWRRGAAKEWRK